MQTYDTMLEKKTNRFWATLKSSERQVIITWIWKEDHEISAIYMCEPTIFSICYKYSICEIIFLKYILIFFFFIRVPLILPYFHTTICKNNVKFQGSQHKILCWFTCAKNILNSFRFLLYYRVCWIFCWLVDSFTFCSLTGVSWLKVE